VDRRNLIFLVGAASILRPRVLAAQQATSPVIGYLSSGTQEMAQPRLVILRKILSDAGYVEGQNLVIEFRFAEGHDDRLAALAADLVSRKVDVIMTGAMPATLAAQKATSTIPIVTAVGIDPVATGLVSNLARPEGNLTGATDFGPRLNIKRFEIMSELVPEARVMAVLNNPANPVREILNPGVSPAKSKEEYGGLMDEATHARGVQLHRVQATNSEEIDGAFARCAELGVGALLIGVDPLFYNAKDQIVGLAARYRIPTIYDDPRYVDAGGLISYGAKAGEAVRLLGTYGARILAGAKPADLPFQMPTKFEMVINRKTADALGLKIPLELETEADRIIE